jgi:hypothetical protein
VERRGEERETLTYDPRARFTLRCQRVDPDGRPRLIHVHKDDIRAWGGGHMARLRPRGRSDDFTPDARPIMITDRDAIVEGNEQRVGISARKKRFKR